MSEPRSAALPATPPAVPRFGHQQTAHCESGTAAALLRDHGTPLSEAMIFGVASGLTFAYLPFVSLGGQPLVSYRMPPRSILRGLARRLGIRMHYETFRSTAAGMAALDAHLTAGRVVGLQTSVFWLPYFPREMRFHFNAHNLVVYAREGTRYAVSDPVFEQPVWCDGEPLARARFARGLLAPKGLLYYPEVVPPRLDLAAAVRRALRFTTHMMLRTPLPLFGIRGVHTVARRIAHLDPAAHERNRLLIGHIVRMQEEIGTGGAGFRFLYAAFLQEAAAVIDDPTLAEASAQMTAAGDAWRQFALLGARICKGREPADYRGLAGLLREAANLERAVFERLARRAA